jgi:signal transduction histidine kinase
VQDENEIEKSERDLQHHNRLAALGSITAGLSHEITSPLTVISTTAELLLDSDDVVPTTREGLERIYEQAGRLTKLLRDFLRFVRNQRLTVKALHALEALEPAVAMCLHHPASKKVRLDVEAEPDLPFIAGDSDRLQQMFLNLLTNACCASPEGDCVTVAVRRAEVSLEGERPAVEYVIADHGPGIPQHDREHIFQPFFSTKARGEGTGLGLPIALRIVEAHGGQLRLASSLKRGTRAIVQLPIWRVEDDLALRPS